MKQHICAWEAWDRNATAHRLKKPGRPGKLDRLFSLGIDQKVPLATREQAVAGQTVRGWLDRLKGLSGVVEPVILLTCQRMEVYGLAVDPLEQLLGTVKAVFPGETIPERWITVYRSLDAVEHLFRVSSGLESMALGEHHVLGQVKKAWGEAHDAGCCGKFMHMLFKRAITLGKRCRAGVDRDGLSSTIGTLALRLVQRTLGDLQGKSALVIGRGEMGKSVIQSLVEGGARQVTVVRRHGADNRDGWLSGLGCSVIGSEEKYRVLTGIDLVVSVTDAPHYTIEYEAFLAHYTGQPLCLVDLAIPRDIDPRIASLAGVTLLTLEHLKQMGFSREERNQDLVKCLEQAVAEEVGKFRRWADRASLDPLIRDWHVYAQTVCKDEFARLEVFLEELPEQQRRAVLSSLERVGRKVVNHSMDHLKLLVEEAMKR